MLIKLWAVLHPRHKLAYFAKAGWEPAWIATAHEIVRAEFDRTYSTVANKESMTNIIEADTIEVHAHKNL
jgi:hypothetical protein